MLRRLQSINNPIPKHMSMRYLLDRYRSQVCVFGRLGGGSWTYLLYVQNICPTSSSGSCSNLLSLVNMFIS